MWRSELYVSIMQGRHINYEPIKTYVLKFFTSLEVGSVMLGLIEI